MMERLRMQVQRLRTRAQFQAVMAGATVARTPHFALHRIAIEEMPASASPSASGSPRQAEGPVSQRSEVLFGIRAPWIGALLPKRWAKRAVTRNAIKRQIFAVSQALAPALPAAAHVVRLRAGFERDRYRSPSSDALKRAVRGELQALFAQARP